MTSFLDEITSLNCCTWTNVHNREKGDIETTLKPDHTPFYDRTIISDPTNLRQTFLNMWLKQDNKSLMIMESATPTDLLRGTFLLTRRDIEYLKSLVLAKWKNKCEEEEVIRLSSFTVTVAYTWICLVKSQFALVEGENSTDRIYLGFAADGRSQVGDQRASNYFGNCVGGRIVDLSLEEMSTEDGVAVAAKAIAGAVESFKKDGAIPKELKKDTMTSVGSMKPGVLSSIAGSPWFNFYEVDFGWGRPKKVEMISIDHSRALSLAESRDSKGGIEVGIVLEEPKMEKFASLFARGVDANE